MPTESDDEACGLDETIPLGAVPEPSARLVVREETPVVTCWNQPFADRFDPAGDETRLRDVLNAVTADSAAVCSSVAAGESAEVTVERPDARDATLRVQTRDDGDRVVGWLFVTPRTGPGIDTVASTLSHDLRNPLDVAKAHLEAASEGSTDPHLGQVAEAHDRMEQIIRNVLALARDEEALSMSPDVDVERVAREAWAAVETGDASLSVADPPSAVEADTDSLRRLFENLFRNSVEHGSTNSRDTRSPDDGVNHVSTEDEPVEIRVGAAADGFFVADDGAGIDATEQSHVFDPGYAGDTDGTGLGLTIVARIARLHGWTVTLTQDDGGARFEFRGVTDGRDG
ncbi:MAG: histidine kinase domain protein, HSP90-like ATPase [uncultured archaeon A07HB70]|nr:MAG: histidine kinase domain protein, HSP90-like ATPase [uncultured archaeon A07HB70]